MNINKMTKLKHCRKVCSNVSWDHRKIVNIKFGPNNEHNKMWFNILILKSIHNVNSNFLQLRTIIQYTIRGIFLKVIDTLQIILVIY